MNMGRWVCSECESEAYVGSPKGVLMPDWIGRGIFSGVKHAFHGGIVCEKLKFLYIFFYHSFQKWNIAGSIYTNMKWECGLASKAMSRVQIIIYIEHRNFYLSANAYFDVSASDLRSHLVN